MEHLGGWKMADTDTRLAALGEIKASKVRRVTSVVKRCEKKFWYVQTVQRIKVVSDLKSIQDHREVIS